MSNDPNPSPHQFLGWIKQYLQRLSKDTTHNIMYTNSGISTSDHKGYDHWANNLASHNENGCDFEFKLLQFVYNISFDFLM